MALNALRKSASGGLGKFILFGFLVLAVGGLVLSDVGGFFRGGISNSDAAIVGKETISIQSFDSTLRRTLNRIGMSPQEAYQAGYVGQLLASEIRTVLLSQAAKKQGILVDKAHIAQQVKSIIDPYVQDGQDPKDVLNQILVSQGMSEKDFVKSIGREIENNLLSAGLNNGFAEVSKTISKDLFRHDQEKRDVEYVVFKNDNIKDIPKPTDDQLFRLYTATKESFVQIEMRRFKLITIKDGSLKESIDISGEEIRATYDDNIDLYTENESRTLDQALLNTQEQARAVIKELNKGNSLKDAVKASTSQTSGYLGERDFDTDSLIEEIKEEVLATTEDGAIIGPVESPIGWYVVVVKKFNPKLVKNFNDVKKEIKNELIENLVIDQHYELANSVDDLFAGGASLEEVSEQIDLDIQTLTTVNRYGQSKENKDGLDKYKDIRTIILETGFQLEDGEASPVFETEDGRFMALYLDELTPKTYTAYEEVQNILSNRWLQDQKRVSNRLKAMGYLTDINANEKSLADFSKSYKKKLYKKKDIGRTDDPDGVLNQRSVMNLFEASLNQTILVDIDGGVALAQITNLQWPTKIDEDKGDYKQFKENLSANMQKDGLTLYLEAKRNDYGAKVNQRLLERIYGPESQNY